MDVNKIRADFPILATKVYGKNLVYLDNGATTQKPNRVLNIVADLYTKYNSNIHRGIHYLSNVSTDMYEDARTTVCKYINAKNTEVIFTSGTTASINLVANTFGETYIKKGDEIIISEMEHHSNIVPWQLLCEKKGAKIKVLPFNNKGELCLLELDSLLNEKTKLVCITHVSNILGTINPVKEITAKCHKHGVPILVDGAQAIQHLKVDVKDIDCDFYVFSGHKIYGPTGTGILYGKENILEKLPPWQGGGDMVKTVTFKKTVYADLPFKFEAGTANYIGSIGLAEAIKYVENIGLDKIETYETNLSNYAWKKLAEIEGLTFYGEAEHRTSMSSFLLDGVHSYDLGSIVDKLGIALRTGHMCAQPVIDHFKVLGLVRASWALYNTKEEIDILCEALRKTKKLFSK